MVTAIEVLFGTYQIQLDVVTGFLLVLFEFAYTISIYNQLNRLVYHYCHRLCAPFLQDAYFTPCRCVEKFGEKKRVSASGYIEERLKTLRVKLSPSKKAHKKHVFRNLLAEDIEDDGDASQSGSWNVRYMAANPLELNVMMFCVFIK